jgi:hypothetical protein
MLIHKGSLALSGGMVADRAPQPGQLATAELHYGVVPRQNQRPQISCRAGARVTESLILLTMWGI